MELKLSCWVLLLGLLLLTHLLVQVSASDLAESSLGCDSCGRDCSAVCGSRKFRSCCFNYIKKRSSGLIHDVEDSETAAQSGLEDQVGSKTRSSKNPLGSLAHLENEIEQSSNSRFHTVPSQSSSSLGSFATELEDRPRDVIVFANLPSRLHRRHSYISNFGLV